MVGEKKLRNVSAFQPYMFGTYGEEDRCLLSHLQDPWAILSCNLGISLISNASGWRSLLEELVGTAEVKLTFSKVDNFW